MNDVVRATDAFLNEERRAGFQCGPAIDNDTGRQIHTVDQWQEGQGYVPANPVEAWQRLTAFLVRNHSSLRPEDVSREIVRRVHGAN